MFFHLPSLCRFIIFRRRPSFSLFSLSLSLNPDSTPPSLLLPANQPTRTGKAASSNNNNNASSSAEPFAEDVRALRERLAAERRAAAAAPLFSPRGRVSAAARRLWLQYLITWAAYCFDWWERLIVHACLLSVVGLCVYGARLGWRAAGAAVGVVSAAAAEARSGGGGGGGLFWGRRPSSSSSSSWSSLASWALN